MNHAGVKAMRTKKAAMIETQTNAPQIFTASGAPEIDGLLKEPGGLLFGMAGPAILAIPVTGVSSMNHAGVKAMRSGPNGPVLGLTGMNYVSAITSESEKEQADTYLTFLVLCGLGKTAQDPVVLGLLQVSCTSLMRETLTGKITARFSVLSESTATPYLKLVPSAQELAGTMSPGSEFEHRLWGFEANAKPEDKIMVDVPVCRMQCVFVLAMLDMLAKESSPEREARCKSMCIQLTVDSAELILRPPRCLALIRYEQIDLRKADVMHLENFKGGFAATLKSTSLSLREDLLLKDRHKLTELEWLDVLATVLRAAMEPRLRGKDAGAWEQGLAFELTPMMEQDGNVLQKLMLQAAKADAAVIAEKWSFAWNGPSKSIAQSTGPVSPEWVDTYAALIAFQNAMNGSVPAGTNNLIQAAASSEVTSSGTPSDYSDAVLKMVLELCRDEDTETGTKTGQTGGFVVCTLDLFRVNALFVMCTPNCNPHSFTRETVNKVAKLQKQIHELTDPTNHAVLASSPAKEAKPAEEAAPAKEAKPAEETKPAEEAAPAAEEAKPTEEAKPAEEAAPAAKEAKSAEVAKPEEEAAPAAETSSSDPTNKSDEPDPKRARSAQPNCS